MAIKYIIIAVFLLSLAWAQQDVKDIEKALESQIPAEFKDKVDKKQIEEIQNKTTGLFKDKCLKNGGPDAFPNAQNGITTMITCLQSYMNMTEVQLEIEENKENGNMDKVFKKYCAKKPEFRQCFQNALDTAKPCFATSEQVNLKTIYNVSEQLAEFVCFKDGDRIALFIAEEGPECLQSKQEAINECFTKTFKSDAKFDVNNITGDNIPDIAFGEEECGQFNALQACMVLHLGDCEQPTTANIVDSLFNFVRKSTPCKKYEPKAPDSASGLYVTSLTLIMAAVSLLV